MYSRTARLVKVLTQANHFSNLGHEEKQKIFRHVEKVKSIMQEPQLDKDALYAELASLEKKMEEVLSFERKLLGREADIKHLEHQLNDLRHKLSLSDSKQLRKRLDRILFLLGELAARADAHAHSKELHEERIAQVDKKVNSFLLQNTKNNNQLISPMSSLEKRYAKLKDNPEIPMVYLQSIESRILAIRQKLRDNQIPSDEEFTTKPIPQPWLIIPEEVGTKPVTHHMLFPHSERNFVRMASAPVEAEPELPSINARKEFLPPPHPSLESSESSSESYIPPNAQKDDIPSIVTVKKKHLSPGLRSVVSVKGEEPEQEIAPVNMCSATEKKPLIAERLKMHPQSVVAKQSEPFPSDLSDVLSFPKNQIPESNTPSHKKAWIPSVVTVKRKPLPPRFPFISSIISIKRKGEEPPQTVLSPKLYNIPTALEEEKPSPPVLQTSKGSTTDLPSIITVKKIFHTDIHQQIVPEKIHSASRNTGEKDIEKLVPSSLDLHTLPTLPPENMEIELLPAPTLRLKTKVKSLLHIHHVKHPRPLITEKPKIRLPPAPKLNLKTKVKHLPPIHLKPYLPLISEKPLPPAPKLNIGANVESLPRITHAQPHLPLIIEKQKVLHLQTTKPRREPLHILQLLHIASKKKSLAPKIRAKKERITHHVPPTKPLHFLPPIFEKRRHRPAITFQKGAHPSKPLHLLGMLHIKKESDTSRQKMIRRKVKHHVPSASKLLQMLPHITLKKKVASKQPEVKSKPVAPISLEDVPSPPHDKLNIDAELAEMEAQIEEDQRSPSRRKKA